MADLFQKTGFKVSRKVEISTWEAKLVLLCVGFVTTLLFFKAGYLLLSTLSPLWISLRSWLSPPYIYIILNFIIIVIAASSSTQSKTNPLNNFKNNTSTTNLPWQDSHEEEEELNPIAAASSTQSKTNPLNNFKNNTSTTNLPWQDSHEEGEGEELNPNLSINEKSFHNPLKETSDSGKKQPGNITGEEAEEETLDTLEDTWRLIMEGKGKKGKPELKKSDTWGTPPRVVVSKEEDGNDPVSREMRKSETFNERVTSRKKREIVQKSMTQDEFTKRVEAFINNFNKDMRLQRQEF